MFFFVLSCLGLIICATLCIYALRYGQWLIALAFLSLALYCAFAMWQIQHKHESPPPRVVGLFFLAILC